MWSSNCPRRGYRFFGPATLHVGGAIFGEARRRTQGRGGRRCRHAALCGWPSVRAARLVSPGYWRVPDERAMRALWRERRAVLDQEIRGLPGPGRAVSGGALNGGAVRGRRAAVHRPGRSADGRVLPGRARVRDRGVLGWGACRLRDRSAAGVRHRAARPGPGVFQPGGLALGADRPRRGHLRWPTFESAGSTRWSRSCVRAGPTSWIGPEDRIYGQREIVVRDCNGQVLAFGESTRATDGSTLGSLAGGCGVLMAVGLLDVAIRLGSGWSMAWGRPSGGGALPGDEPRAPDAPPASPGGRRPSRRRDRRGKLELAGAGGAPRAAQRGDHPAHHLRDRLALGRGLLWTSLLPSRPSIESPPQVFSSAPDSDWRARW